MTQEPLPGDDEEIQDADEVPDPPNDEVTDEFDNSANIEETPKESE